MSEENELIEIYDDDNVDIHDAAIKVIPALYALAASSESLSNRIIKAYHHIVHIRDTSLTAELLAEYKAFVRHMTRKRTPDSPVRATVEAMNEEQLRETAERIIRFHDGIRKEAYRRRFECREH